MQPGPQTGLPHHVATESLHAAPFCNLRDAFCIIASPCLQLDLLQPCLELSGCKGKAMFLIRRSRRLIPMAKALQLSAPNEASGPTQRL